MLFLIKYDKNNNIHFASNQTKAGETIMKQYLVNHDDKLFQDKTVNMPWSKGGIMRGFSN